MEIKHRSDHLKGLFFIEEDGHRLAEMSYVMSGPTLMVIDHTEVSPLLKGKGVGRDLVAAGVDLARRQAWKIIPTCPFARAEFQKHAEYADVLSQ